MKTSRLRPKWTLGTMLLVVGWSSVVVWLNVRPRVGLVSSDDREIISVVVFYGYPFPHAYSWMSDDVSDARPLHMDYFTLALNAIIGVFVLAVSTLTSKYLLRAIAALLTAILSKPPRQDKGD